MIICERMRSVMVKAKVKGAKIGRPQTALDNIPVIFLKHYPSYKNGNLNVSEFAKVCDVSRTTIHKYLELLKT